MGAQLFNTKAGEDETELREEKQAHEASLDRYRDVCRLAGRWEGHRSDHNPDLCAVEGVIEGELARLMEGCQP